jgi:cation diffusion facilitator CzcD-associated flavoprotein CzcO
VDERLDLSRDVELIKGVISAAFDNNSCRWNVRLCNGEVIDCKYLVLCTGFAAKTYIPDWRGLYNFKGIMHHTGKTSILICKLNAKIKAAKYPQSGIDYKGKKVAVIGTGASGVQTIQEIGSDVEHLTVFQRTPNLCLPMGQRKLDAQTEAYTKKEGGYEDIFKYRRTTFGGMQFDFSDKAGDDDNAEQKREFYEKLWADGSFRFWLATYKDLLYDKKVSPPRMSWLAVLDCCYSVGDYFECITSPLSSHASYPGSVPGEC